MRTLVEEIQRVMLRIRKRREVELSIAPCSRGWNVTIIETYVGPTGDFGDDGPWCVDESGFDLGETIRLVLDLAVAELDQEDADAKGAERRGNRRGTKGAKSGWANRG